MEINSSSKWAVNQWRTRNINITCGPGIAKECTVQWGFKKFAKEMRVLKMRSTVAGHQK